MRRAAKRDKNERAVIDTWEAMGAYVESVSGPGLADTLVHHRDLFRAEVKGAKCGLTKKQVENFEKAWLAGVPTYIIRTTTDAKDLLTDSASRLRLEWRPEMGALAGAARKERPFRPGTDRARAMEECCSRTGCATSRSPGLGECAAHAAEAFASPPTNGLDCERCGHSWDVHTHSHSPVPKSEPERCVMPGCTCEVYVGLGPSSLRSGA